MKAISNILIVGVLVIAFASCKDTSNENKVKQVKDNYSKRKHSKTIFENDYAKVEEFNLEPGDNQQMHYGTNRVIYSLNDYEISWLESDNELEKKKWKKGDVHYHNKDFHKARNVGDNTAKWLAFRQKKNAKNNCENGLNDDVTEVRPDISKTLLNNNKFKVVRVNLPVGDSIPNHSGVNRIIYALNDYSIEYASNNKAVVKKEFEKGHTHWHNDCKHSLKNIGTNEATFLIVSYK